MPNQTSSRLPKILYGFLVAIAVSMMLPLLLTEPTGGHGSLHDDFPPMLKGYTGGDRLGVVRWIGLALALSLVGFFVTCLVIGLRKHGGRARWMIGIGLLYAATFSALVLAEHSTARGNVPSIVMGFPLPTAIMMYGISGVPVLFSALYVLHFDRWILEPDDQKRIESIAREKRDDAEETR